MGQDSQVEESGMYSSSESETWDSLGMEQDTTPEGNELRPRKRVSDEVTAVGRARPQSQRP